MAFLTRLFARRLFPLPQFDLAPLAFELEGAKRNELALGAPAAAGQADATAILAAPRTPGEMRESIERHLRLVRNDDPPLLEQDAVDELRESLAELRRSLG